MSWITFIVGLAVGAFAMGWLAHRKPELFARVVLETNSVVDRTNAVANTVAEQARAKYSSMTKKPEPVVPPTTTTTTGNTSTSTSTSTGTGTTPPSDKPNTDGPVREF